MVQFFKNGAPNLLKIVQFVCSSPVSNAFVEQIFSVMGNVWTDEKNRKHPKKGIVRSFQYNASCTEFKDAISCNKPLLKAESSNAKYITK